MVRALSTAIRDRRRDRIVRIATEVFFEDGYGAATMQAISERLGGSKATLYAYFKNKEDLLEAIIRAQCDGLSAALEQVGAPADLREQLGRLGMAFMSVLVSEAGVRTMQLAIDASRDSPALAQRFEDVGVRNITDQLTAFLRDADDRGVLAAPDPAFAASIFTTLMRGDLHFRRLLNLMPVPPAEDVRSEVDRAVGLFLTAFGARGR